MGVMRINALVALQVLARATSLSDKKEHNVQDVPDTLDLA